MENNIKLLDGSMSYPLELDGYNLNNRLWTGDALINNPELIKKIHKGYINSGADYLLTSTYQISYDILREKGINSEKIKGNDYSRVYTKNKNAFFQKVSFYPNSPCWPPKIFQLGPCWHPTSLVKCVHSNYKSLSILKKVKIAYFMVNTRKM